MEPDVNKVYNGRLPSWVCFPPGVTVRPPGGGTTSVRATWSVTVPSGNSGSSAAAPAGVTRTHSGPARVRTPRSTSAGYEGSRGTAVTFRRASASRATTCSTDGSRYRATRQGLPSPGIGQCALRVAACASSAA
ncbi:hypothetical protein GCM10010345_69720 [Streptomyces canarius]|uniref:Uncharacterized protein n=1 Tax=Streptomyces canarius TaxID=285453 RepID=A0ABQ3D3U5_9ACTN|nr:hypothetical protein GCM10010345_69720 [Streptomyces canarius]